MICSAGSYPEPSSRRWSRVWTQLLHAPLVREQRDSGLLRELSRKTECWRNENPHCCSCCRVRCCCGLHSDSCVLHYSRSRREEPRSASEGQFFTIDKKHECQDERIDPLGIAGLWNLYKCLVQTRFAPVHLKLSQDTYNFIGRRYIRSELKFDFRTSLPLTKGAL